jgi:hypothetical protein
VASDGTNKIKGTCPNVTRRINVGAQNLFHMHKRSIPPGVITCGFKFLMKKILHVSLKKTKVNDLLCPQTTITLCYALQKFASRML